MWISDGFNETVKKELFNLIGRILTAGAADTDGYPQFTPKGVALLMPKLIPPFQKRMGTKSLRGTRSVRIINVELSSRLQFDSVAIEFTRRQAT